MSICRDVQLADRRPDAGLAGLSTALSAARGRAAAFDALAWFVAGLGLSDVTLTIESGPLQKRERIRHSTLDPARIARLDEIGFDGHDPIRSFARRCVDPFAWSRTDWPGGRTPAAESIMLALREVDVEAGITLAVWGRGGRVAIADAFGSAGEVRAVAAGARDALFAAVALAFLTIERLSLARRLPPLTRREFEILELATQGLTSGAIARRLQIVEQTVKFHFTGIRKKLEVRSRSEAVARFSELYATSFRSEARFAQQGSLLSG